MTFPTTPSKKVIAMDMEQEDMQFLGIFGVYREAYKIIFSWRKIFSQITLAFVIPLSFIYLVHMEVSDLPFSRIIHHEIVLDETRAGTSKHNKLSDVVTSAWITLWIFKAGYFTFLLIFSLLSTSAVVYTIACIYTGWRLSMASRVGYGIICLLLLFKLMLFGLIIQTVIYFVCKSYHHENIDKSALSDHLEVYLGEYVSLKAKDV